MFNISERKAEHIKLCLTDEVNYEEKTNGFEYYEFPHFAATEVNPEKVNTSMEFFGKSINFPFLISCMTGGSKESERINEQLAIAANELNIPIGVGSQRQALIKNDYLESYQIIKKNAGNVPILGNIGAAQIAKSKSPVDDIKKLIEMINADALVIHLNPLQEIFQKEGEPDFRGLKKNVELICKKVSTPIVIKEVGSGISSEVAKQFLNIGVKGIDVAGSGGTSWAKVEMKRSKEYDEFFAEWGLPTSYCIRKNSKLKKKFDFILIASGGINHYSEIAKSLVLGADLTASAKKVLNELLNGSLENLIVMLNLWFRNVKKIMYLTNCENLKEFHKIKLIKRNKLF